MEAPAIPTTETAASTMRRSVRAKKTVEKISMDMEIKSQFVDLRGRGQGVPLGEIHNVNFQISKRTKTPHVAVIHDLHKLLFGTVGKKAIFRANLRKFNGFPEGEDTSVLLNKLKKMTAAKLTRFIYLLDIVEGSGGVDEKATAIMAFLVNPQEREGVKPFVRLHPTSGRGLVGRKATKKKSKKKASTKHVREEEEEEEVKPKKKTKKSKKKASTKHVREEEEEVKPKKKTKEAPKEEESSSEEDAPTDDQIQAMVAITLKGRNMKECTPKIVRKELEDFFECSLKDKKSVIREAIMAYLKE